jgi:peptide/nickel transport system permease protein
MLSSRKRRIDALAALSGPLRSAPGDDGGGAVATVDDVSEVQVADAGHLDESMGVSLLASAWKRLRRNPIFLTGATIVVLFLLLALFSPLLAPHDPTERLLINQISQQTNPVPGPQPGFPLGGDNLGRDLLSRLIVGSRQTLYVGVFATLGGLLGGLTLGTLAGALGGWVDSLVMRAVDVMLSIPSLLLAFSIAAMASALAVDGHHRHRDRAVPVFARLLRGTMLAATHSDHVLAARALGVKPGAIVFRHMLPNALGPVIVQATLVLATSDHRRRGPVLPRPRQPRRPPSPSGARCSAGPDVHPTTRTWPSTRPRASSSSPSGSPSWASPCARPSTPRAGGERRDHDDRPDVPPAPSRDAPLLSGSATSR